MGQNNYLPFHGVTFQSQMFLHLPTTTPYPLTLDPPGERDRERDRYLFPYQSKYINTYKHPNTYIHIHTYVYIEKRYAHINIYKFTNMYNYNTHDFFYNLISQVQCPIS